MTGTSRAWRRIPRIRLAYRRRAASTNRANSRSSAANALTTRIPEIVSSTTAARSPAFCWASQVAGYSWRRKRFEATTTPGTRSRAIAVSSGLRTAITASDISSMTAFPVTSGRNPTSSWIIRTSELARDMI